MDRRILVVEDEEDVAGLLVSRLRSAGYQVLAVPDAALATKQAMEFKPDLIILDLMLPGGGGLAVLKRLKLSIHTRLIPVVVLTAARDPELRRQVLAAGVNSYLTKPYDAQHLLAEVESLLSTV